MSSPNVVFDSDGLSAAVRVGSRSLLMRFGAYTRQRARSMIRKRKAISDPGSPPSSHTGRFRDSILFAFDPASQSVVIGSVAASRVPSVIEFGGMVTAAGDRRPHFHRARPVIGPAFKIELQDRLSDDLRSLLKGK